MTNLVTLEAVKRHQRIWHSDDDPDLDDMISQASDIILNYIGNPEPEWTDQTAPPIIQTAVLFQVGLMWADRGDSQPVYAPMAIWIGVLHQSCTVIANQFWHR